MAFSKIDKSKTLLPPRQWALVGYPGSGKSTFAAQMAGPLLVVDSDHRFQEVARFASGDVYEISANPADHMDAEIISGLVRDNIDGSAVRTIVVDSLTSIITPLVVQAILDNDAGRNKNRAAAFKDKALAMRLLQDSITGTGRHTLWIYHLRDGLDGQAKHVESASISPVELARLRRSLNMQLRIIEKDDKRGIRVDWARCGRSGMTLWDESGCWLDMPAKIEQAVYAGLSLDDMSRIEESAPITFAGPEDAIAWGVEQECFRDAVHAQNAYNKVKADKKPAAASDMWRLWVDEVERRKAESQKPENPFADPDAGATAQEREPYILAITAVAKNVYGKQVGHSELIKIAASITGRSIKGLMELNYVELCKVDAIVKLDGTGFKRHPKPADWYKELAGLLPTDKTIYQLTTSEIDRIHSRLDIK